MDIRTHQCPALKADLIRWFVSVCCPDAKNVEEAGRMMGLSKRHIDRWLDGQDSFPGPQNLLRIAAALSGYDLGGRPLKNPGLQWRDLVERTLPKPDAMRRFAVVGQGRETASSYPDRPNKHACWRLTELLLWHRLGYRVDLIRYCDWEARTVAWMPRARAPHVRYPPLWLPTDPMRLAGCRTDTHSTAAQTPTNQQPQLTRLRRSGNMRPTAASRIRDTWRTRGAPARPQQPEAPQQQDDAPPPKSVPDDVMRLLD